MNPAGPLVLRERHVNHAGEDKDAADYEKANADYRKDAKNMIDVNWQCLISFVSTWGAIIAAFIQAIAAVIAVCVVKKELRQNKENNERQLRAYVTVSDVSIGAHESDPRKFRVSAKFQNSGQTPAIDVSAVIHGAVRHGTEFTCDRPMESVEGGRSSLVIGNGSKPAIVSHAVDLYQGLTASEVLTGDYSVFAYGVVKYRDAFDAPHETEFCYVSNPASRGSATPIIAAESGNKSS